MPGLPKPADKRARRNAPVIDFRSVQITPGEQPPLPDRDRAWSVETLAFWDSLGASELAAEFTDAEWRVLMLAALIHEEVWVEQRMTRVDQFMAIMSKFPFTPKDRQALRIQTLTGDQLEQKSERPESKAASSAKKSYGALKVV